MEWKTDELDGRVKAIKWSGQQEHRMSPTFLSCRRWRRRFIQHHYVFHVSLTPCLALVYPRALARSSSDLRRFQKPIKTLKLSRLRFRQASHTHLRKHRLAQPFNLGIQNPTITNACPGSSTMCFSLRCTETLHEISTRVLCQEYKHLLESTTT